MTEITISPLQKKQLPQVIELLGKAYANNPLHVAVFGKNNVESNTRFMGGAFKNITGDIFVAESARSIVGVIRITKHPQPPAPVDATPPRLTPESLSISASAIDRILEWMSIWNKLDPPENHYHFGPVGVLPDLQRQLIGTRMMEYCCKILDREGETGYLETETTDHVRFYNKFGFHVFSKITVLGLPNWTMKRLPKPPK